MTRIAVAVFVAILALTGVAPATAQKSSDTGSLVALCETNAPDEAIRDDCLYVVATILHQAKATMPWESFEAGLSRVIEPYSSRQFVFGPDDQGKVVAERPLDMLRSGRWTPKDPESGRKLDVYRKKQAKRARVVAGMAAEDLRELLLSVTPEDCYAEVYGALWGVAAAWDNYADRLGNVERVLTPALEEFARVSSVTYCGPPRYHVDVAPPPTMGS